MSDDPQIHRAMQGDAPVPIDVQALLAEHADAVAELIDAQSEVTRIEAELDDLGIAAPPHNA